MALAAREHPPLPKPYAPGYYWVRVGTVRKLRVALHRGGGVWRVLGIENDLDTRHLTIGPRIDEPTGF